MYKKTFDTVSPTQTKNLTHFDRQFYTTTTSHDPIIEQLASDDSQGPTVFASSTSLAVRLYCAVLSIQRRC